jgi:ubiquinone/menaquinone biosynthesis C-methylase UbiE
VPTWYESSTETIGDFEKVGRTPKVLGTVPLPFPLYDLIMGLYERKSNRDALRGPLLRWYRNIVDVGSGTGYMLGRLAAATSEPQKITAVDPARRMVEDSRSYLERRHLLSSRIAFEQADCRSLPHPDGSVDLYVSTYLFDLLPEVEIRAGLSELSRVLGSNGMAIILTMTTELEDIGRFRRTLFRAANELYCVGYHRGRWNRIWRFLFSGYAPHCRPIGLGSYLRETPGLTAIYSKASRILFLPIRIYYVRKDIA